MDFTFKEDKYWVVSGLFTTKKDSIHKKRIPTIRLEFATVFPPPSLPYEKRGTIITAVLQGNIPATKKPGNP
jgi:uncharacterized membrane protein YcgQ (UPF0703/DUF1980 family)